MSTRSPEADIYDADGIPILIVMFDEGLYEVPNLAAKNGPMLDTSNASSEYQVKEESMRSLAGLGAIDDLVPVDQKMGLVEGSYSNTINGIVEDLPEE